LPVAVGVTDCEPLVALDPVQALEAVQPVASVVVQLSVEACPRMIVPGDAPSVSVGGGRTTCSVVETVMSPPVPVQVSV